MRLDSRQHYQGYNVVVSLIPFLRRHPQSADLPPSTLRRLPAEQMMAEVAAKVQKTSCVLDIGPGLRPMQFFVPQTHIFLEGFAPYLALLQQRYGREPGHVFIHGLAEKALPLFPDRSVDSIMMIDVIEHLPKARARKVLRHCERIARRQIVIGTPYGFVEQDYEEGELDGWSFAHNQLQTHRSGWTEKDFSHGWELLLCDNFAQHQQHQASYGLLYAFRQIAPAGLRFKAHGYLISALVPPHNANPYSAFFTWLDGAEQGGLTIITDHELTPHAPHDHIADLPKFCRHRLAHRYYGVKQLYEQSSDSLAQQLNAVITSSDAVLFFTAEQPKLAAALAEFCLKHQRAGVCVYVDPATPPEPHPYLTIVRAEENWTPEHYQQALASLVAA